MKPNKKIDTRLSTILFDLMGQPQGEPTSLASRNLLRNLAMKVPSGQRVAKAMKLPVLAPGDLDDLEGFQTKASFKTTEFFAFLVVLAGLLIAGNSIEGKDGGADYFAGDKVWLYVTLLTIGYMVSRGLAKSGSREPYDDTGANR